MPSSSDARFRPSQATLKGDNADVYFHRTLEILRAEKLNPVVTMEVFCRKRVVLAGTHEVRALLEEVLPAGAEVWGMEEGDVVEPLEVVLRITAPYQSFALYETAYLGMLAHETGWATAARACVEAAAPTPVISFGARHVHPDISARMEYAAIVGGCIGCATPGGARLAGIEPSGTIPHALVLSMGDTVKAIQAFDRVIDPRVNRIALVDTFKDEAEESLRVARAMGDRLWGVRLDTPSERGGVTAALVREVRARLDGAGFQHVKIVVSGGVTPERIAYYKAENAPIDAYGIGSAISAAPPVDFTADIKEIEGRAVAKRGRIPGVTPNHRMKRWI